MHLVHWYEIPVADIERAKGFYESVFGVELSMNNMDGYEMAWFPMKAGEAGATGALVKGEGYSPSMEGSIVYMSVQDIDQTIEKITSNGGEIIMPKKDIGEYGMIAMFKDCEGNKVGLHMDTAKA